MTVKEFDKVIKVVGIAFRVPGEEVATSRDDLVLVPQGADRFSACIQATIDSDHLRLLSVTEI